MKVAVTSQGMDLASQVDPRFGRAKYFVLVDTDTGTFTAHDNRQNLNAAQGAGIQAGRNVVELGAEAVITGNVGPKAFTTLQGGGTAANLLHDRQLVGTLLLALPAFDAVFHGLSRTFYPRL